MILPRKSKGLSPRISTPQSSPRPRSTYYIPASNLQAWHATLPTPSVNSAKQRSRSHAAMAAKREYAPAPVIPSRMRARMLAKRFDIPDRYPKAPASFRSVHATPTAWSAELVYASPLSTPLYHGPYEAVLEAHTLDVALGMGHSPRFVPSHVPAAWIRAEREEHGWLGGGVQLEEDALEDQSVLEIQVAPAVMQASRAKVTRWLAQMEAR
ncbi:unnamed protein product [Peniophora sp. CBMAI 1063]|nr:unnamed protein product [Peniophora sp. CBMAI 1063]